MLGKMCSLVLDNHKDLNVTGSFNNKEATSLLLEKKINLVKFDVLNDNLKEIIDKVKPEYIINCIGKIKPVIDEDTILVFDEFLMNESWEQDEFKALNEFCAKNNCNYEVLAVSFLTKQVAVRLLGI